MAGEFKIGDLVWAKMKGYPPWPGKVVEPKPEVKKPADKRPKQFVFFFGSENYAWVTEDNIWGYAENKERFGTATRSFRGFQEGVDAMEEIIKKQGPGPVRVSRAQSPALSETKPTETKGKEQKSSQKAKKDESRKSLGSKDEKKKDSTETKAQKRSSSAAVLSSPPPAKTRLLEKESPSPPATQGKSSRFDFDDGAPSRSSGMKKAPAVASTSAENSKTMNSLMTDQLFLPDILPSLEETLPPKNIIATPMKIGFLGLGIMGSGMVDNLLKSGHEVTVWNRTTSKCKEFIKDGALKGSNPSEVVQSCDITFSCVTDPSALKDLVFGNCGVLQGISQGKGYVDMSTVDSETITDVNEAITARGGRFLEAPVIGNKHLAKTGQLVILAAGDQTLYEDCDSCFRAMGRHIFHLGEVGSATKMKLVLNILIGSTLAGLAESLALASKLGLDTNEVLTIINNSTASSQFLREKGSDMVNNRINEPSCKLQIMQKDLRLAINMSDTVDQPLHVSSAVNELFKKAKAKGYGEHDIAALCRAADL